MEEGGSFPGRDLARPLIDPWPLVVLLELEVDEGGNLQAACIKGYTYIL
jgi:hypothetical protein